MILIGEVILQTFLVLSEENNVSSSFKLSLPKLSFNTDLIKQQQHQSYLEQVSPTNRMRKSRDLFFLRQGGEKWGNSNDIQFPADNLRSKAYGFKENDDPSSHSKPKTIPVLPRKKRELNYSFLKLETPI